MLNSFSNLHVYHDYYFTDFTCLIPLSVSVGELAVSINLLDIMLEL